MGLFPFVFLLIRDESDRQFMEELYTQYHRLLYAQALRVLRSRQAAEDAVSEALVQLIKKTELLRSLECNKLRAYIVITVRHTAINQLNRNKRERGFDGVDIEELAGSERVDERLLSRAGVENIKNAIRALPEREKDVMLMRFFREMTEEEIAREMGVKPVTVRVCLSRARKHLAQALGERKGGEE